MSSGVCRAVTYGCAASARLWPVRIRPPTQRQRHMNFGKLDRRNLIKQGSLLAGMPFLPFLRECSPGGGRGGYGPIVERDGALLYLPQGFEYVAFSPVGARMSDGHRVPGAHDGMRAFSVPGK